MHSIKVPFGCRGVIESVRGHVGVRFHGCRQTAHAVLEHVDGAEWPGAPYPSIRAVSVERSTGLPSRARLLPELRVALRSLSSGDYGLSCFNQAIPGWVTNRSVGSELGHNVVHAVTDCVSCAALKQAIDGVLSFCPWSFRAGLVRLRSPRYLVPSSSAQSPRATAATSPCQCGPVGHIRFRLLRPCARGGASGPCVAPSHNGAGARTSRCREGTGCGQNFFGWSGEGHRQDDVVDQLG